MRYDAGASVSDPITGVLGDGPNATTDVSINGANNKVGTTWTLTAPTWSTPGFATSYQWYRDATPITGATSGTLQARGARCRRLGHGARDGDQGGLPARHVDQQRRRGRATGPADRLCHADHHRRRQGEGDPHGDPRHLAGLERHLHLPVVRQRRGCRQGDQQDLRRTHSRRGPSRVGARDGQRAQLGGRHGLQRRGVRREADIDDDGDRRRRRSSPNASAPS